MQQIFIISISDLSFLIHLFWTRFSFFTKDQEQSMQFTIHKKAFILDSQVLKIKKVFIQI